jgi:hypothetical protein
MGWSPVQEIMPNAKNFEMNSELEKSKGPEDEEWINK